jgi:hypothetical protein
LKGILGFQQKADAAQALSVFEPELGMKHAVELVAVVQGVVGLICHI